MTTMRTTILFLSLVLISFKLTAQFTSIHHEQLSGYKALGNSDASFFEAKPYQTPISAQKTGCNLNKVVYGWHPYWVGNAYQNYQWDLLSHFSFFSYEVNAADGEPLTTHGWSTSAAVDAALATGNTKVTLCVTLFSGHTTFFGSSAAQQTLIDNLINLVQTRGAHGVNIDFEGVPSSEATAFCNFMVDLSNQMHTAIPGSEVSTVLYAVDWNGVFDFSIMEPAVDQYIIMGYGYYYSGSGNAGPTDPLYHFGNTYNYTLSKTITYYLDSGCPSEKLVMGLPEYGYEWSTSSTSIPSAATASGGAKTYAVVKNNTSGDYAQSNHIWESDSYTDVYVFNNGSTKQCFISLDSAWRKRLDHINKTGIAGIGIWALGYDDGYMGLWNAMEDYLTDCYTDPCSGSIHDFGGPKNYYNNEDYTWTIAPSGATSLDIDFTMFDVELNYDYLYVYDGADDQSPQIAGSPFTGTVGPGSFTTSSGAVTFRFYSDGATVNPGFEASYTCDTQAAPVSSFIAGGDSVCQGDSLLIVSTSSDADSFNWSTSSGGLSSMTSDSVYLFPSSSGSYTITLTVSNGVGNDQSSQQIPVTVVDPPIASASVNSNNLWLPNATAFFSNTSNNATSYLWYFGDGNTSTDQSPWHDYTASGTYTVSVIAMNNVCLNDTAFLIINVGTAGFEDLSGTTYNVYPNPSNGLFTVEASAMTSYNCSLLDLHGKVLTSKFSKGNTLIDIREFASGIYFLEIKDGSRVNRVRLVKK
jgi:spore germination protein YaaH/PKD repeat protein